MNKYIGSSLESVISNEMKDATFAEEFDRQKVISEIAQQVHTIRVKSGMTQKKMAEASHTTQQVIARIENGTDSRMPSIDLLNRIAQAAGKKFHLEFV